MYGNPKKSRGKRKHSLNFLRYFVKTVCFWQKKAAKQDEPSIDEQIQMKKVLKGVPTDQQFQHTKLMNEFKQAHQKMFRSTSNEDDGTTVNTVIGKETMVSYSFNKVH